MIPLDNLTEMLKGVLEGCVLETISCGETYGYEITRRLNALGFTDVVDGTVYTILVRLEKNGLVDIEKKPSDMGPPRLLTANTLEFLHCDNTDICKLCFHLVCNVR